MAARVCAASRCAALRPWPTQPRAPVRLQQVPHAHGCRCWARLSRASFSPALRLSEAALDTRPHGRCMGGQGQQQVCPHGRMVAAHEVPPHATRQHLQLLRGGGRVRAQQDVVHARAVVVVAYALQPPTHARARVQPSRRPSACCTGRARSTPHRPSILYPHAALWQAGSACQRAARDARMGAS